MNQRWSDDVVEVESDAFVCHRCRRDATDAAPVMWGMAHKGRPAFYHVACLPPRQFHALQACRVAPGPVPVGTDAPPDMGTVGPQGITGAFAEGH